MTTHTFQQHELSLNDQQAPPHLDLKQAQSDLSLAHASKLSAADPTIPSDSNTNQTALTI